MGRQGENAHCPFLVGTGIREPAVRGPFARRNQAVEGLDKRGLTRQVRRDGERPVVWPGDIAQIGNIEQEQLGDAVPDTRLRRGGPTGAEIGNTADHLRQIVDVGRIARLFGPDTCQTTRLGSQERIGLSHQCGPNPGIQQQA